MDTVYCFLHALTYVTSISSVVFIAGTLAVFTITTLTVALAAQLRVTVGPCPSGEAHAFSRAVAVASFIVAALGTYGCVTIVSTPPIVAYAISIIITSTTVT